MDSAGDVTAYFGSAYAKQLTCDKAFLSTAKEYISPRKIRTVK